jgi:hypothetical protein
MEQHSGTGGRIRMRCACSGQAETVKNFQKFTKNVMRFTKKSAVFSKKGRNFLIFLNRFLDADCAGYAVFFLAAEDSQLYPPNFTADKCSCRRQCSKHCLCACRPPSSTRAYCPPIKLTAFYLTFIYEAEQKTRYKTANRLFGRCRD